MCPIRYAGGRPKGLNYEIPSCRHLMEPSLLSDTIPVVSATGILFEKVDILFIPPFFRYKYHKFKSESLGKIIRSYYRIHYVKKPH